MIEFIIYFRLEE